MGEKREPLIWTKDERRTVEMVKKSIDQQQHKRFQTHVLFSTSKKSPFSGRHEIWVKVKYYVWFSWFFIFVTFWIWQREIKWFRYAHTRFTCFPFNVVICARIAIYIDIQSPLTAKWETFVFRNYCKKCVIQNQETHQDPSTYSVGELRRNRKFLDIAVPRNITTLLQRRYTESTESQGVIASTRNL